MNVGLLREELCQVMGLMSQGIMGQIQPDAGSEEGMKSCSTREDRPLSVTIPFLNKLQ